MTLSEARLLANVNERSKRLFVDGYRAERLDEYAVEVTSPKGESYEIDPLFETCTCPFYHRWKGEHPCKHLLGWEQLLEDQETATRQNLAVRDDWEPAHPKGAGRRCRKR
jgi:hypothetical protein